MSNTKSESLKKIDSNTKAKSYAAIKHALYSNGPLSRSQLAEVTTLKLSSVCGRVSELMKMGVLLEVGTTYDHNTERNVKTVALSNKVSA